ncbi:MAG TPA: dienelactone hydrolase family protein [Ideonella sp.]|nr:dienelactone hydrolase family protein [Ideonella sp.]
MSDPAPMKKASDFPPEVLSLFDKYVHGGLDRRGFLDGAAKFAVGGVTAAGLLEALSPRFAYAQKVPSADTRIKTESIEFPSPQGYGKARAYVVRPAQAAGPLPVVLVIHENRGLNPHIEDIARRLALDNFIAVAPDALYPLGGYPGDEDKARELFAKLDQTKTVEDLVAAAAIAKTVPGGNGKVGAVGFCYGGGIVNLLAARVPDLGAGVPFYGVAPPLDQVARIKAPLMLMFADNDERVNASWPPYEAALKTAGVKYEAFKYPGTQHGFNNDTTPRYDEAAANQAWARTIALFNRTLRG